MRILTVVAAHVSTVALADTANQHTVLIQDRPSGSHGTTVRAHGGVDVDLNYRKSTSHT
jgi:hypothetical protein